MPSVVAFAERFPSTGSVSDSLILYLAYDAADVWLSFLDGIAPDTDVNGTTTTGATNFRKAFVLALANPYEILFWLTIGVGLLQLGTLGALAWVPSANESLSGVLVVGTGLFGGIVV